MSQPSAVDRSHDRMALGPDPAGVGVDHPPARTPAPGGVDHGPAPVPAPDGIGTDQRPAHTPPPAGVGEDHAIEEPPAPAGIGTDHGPTEPPTPAGIGTDHGRAAAPRGRATALLMLALVALLLGLRVITAAAQDDAGAPAAADATGSIAYVNATNYDEIRLINPDGSNNRRVWAHGQADPQSVYYVTSLSWNPAASELAFTSTHENWCSINFSDIFTVAVNGRNYKRITQAPSCGALAGYPKGTVRVPVRNSSIFGNSFAGFVYFQGAPTLLPLALPAGSTSVLTFNNVADLGPGALQLAAMIVPPYREVSIASAVDVIAGQTVTTASMNVYTPDASWEARYPTWRSDGSAIAYVLNFASLFKLPPNPEPLDLGQEVQTNNAAMPDFVDLLAYGPPSKANQLLYVGNLLFDSEGIYLLNEGSANAGEKLVSYRTFEQVRGLAWLPDGSGFVFSVEEVDDSFQSVKANIFAYNFATKQTTRLTNFSNQFAGQLSVSPDGQQIVFDRSSSKEWVDRADIWIMNRNGSNQRLLVANGRAPAWSPRAVVVPRLAFLPAVVRGR